jgi:hypothetical protein
MSSRGLLAAPPSSGSGVTDLTAIRLPHWGHGRRKLGRWEGIMFSLDT